MTNFNTKSMVLALTLVTLSACNGNQQRSFEKTANLSPGVRALLNAEPDIKLTDARIRCKRDSTSASRLGRQTCSTVEELNSERTR